MDESVAKEIKSKEHSKFHQAMLNHCNKLVKSSRDGMSKFYSIWDRNADVYRGLRKPDKEDKKAAERDEPVKMSIPLTYAQVQTFVSFAFLLFTQNSDFYSFQPTGDEDYPVRKDAERFLRRDLERNKFLSQLYQFLLDIGRFNLGVIKHGWVEDYVRVPVQVTIQPTKFMGIALGKERIEEQMKKVLRYEGNKIVAVSPYRFYPDVTLPFSRFQEGNFCASEDEMSRSDLASMEDSGEVAGVEYIEDFTVDRVKARGESRFNRVAVQATGATPDAPCGTVLVTEVQVKIVPSKFEIEEGKMLGDEDYPVMYNVWIANDNRVIKCEPMGYLHQEFTYDIAQFAPDQHENLGQGLADVIDHLQSVITWFVNSHIASVRKTIDNRLVVDPAGIDTKTLESRSPIIYMKKGKSSTGVDRWIKQLQVVDVTGNHMNDAEVLTKMMQLITGVNDNAMGQYNSGRRSATEARAVTAGAASRLKVTAVVIWTDALNPLGRKLLTNLRQGITEETFARVVGRPNQEDPASIQAFQQRWTMFKGNPEELVGSDDFFVFDTTLPSEKGFIAQSLQELLGIILQNPETAVALDINPQALLREIYELRGIQNMDRFSLQQTKANEPPKVVETGPAQLTAPSIAALPQAAA